MITVRSCAKINLTLEVTGKRTDGYHNIASVMQAIDLCDTLSLEPHPVIHFECSVPALNTPQNLVVRAAHMLADEAGVRQGARIRLDKRIPEAGGLGGGSSNAAAALKGLNEQWGLGLPTERLAPLAAALGSDVPFFLYGGAALARGRGEKIAPLSAAPATWLVLLLPGMAAIPNKTAGLYARITSEHYTREQATRRLKARLEKGQPPQASWLYNVFEKVAFDFFPGLPDYRQRFLEAGARSVHLAGSGPTLFTLASDEHEAHELWHRLSGMGLKAEMARTVSPTPSPSS